MTTAQTTSPTDPGYFANHSTDALNSIVKRYTADSAFIATNSGADHPLAIEALRLANAAWAELVVRGEA